MTLNNFFQLLRGRARQRGAGGRAGGLAATTRGWRIGGWFVSRNGRRYGLSPADRPALLAPRRPSHWLASANNPHLPAPRPEVSKVNEKFHP